jgi:Ribonuclease G/E
MAAALVGAGCGGDSDEDKAKEYREGLNEADSKFDRELAAAGTTMRAAGQSKSREQYGQGAQALQEAVDEFKADLEELETPSDAENEEEAVTEAVDEFAGSVRRINQAVQARDDDAVRLEAATVQQKGAEVDQAIDTLKEAVE